MKQMVMVFALCFASSSWAAKETGNGGDAVVCNMPSGQKTVSLYDYFEMPRYSLQLDLGPASLSVDEKINFVLNRLTRIDPGYSDKLRELYADFWKETSFLSEAILKEIHDDTSPIEVGPGCSKVQFAIRLENPKPFEKRYLIDEALWNLASNDTRAGLVLHELIYRLEKERNSDLGTSDWSRYYNAIISSRDITTMDFTTYLVAISSGRRLGSPHQIQFGRYRGYLVSPSYVKKSDGIVETNIRILEEPAQKQFLTVLGKQIEIQKNDEMTLINEDILYLRKGVDSVPSGSLNWSRESWDMEIDLAKFPSPGHPGYVTFSDSEIFGAAKSIKLVRTSKGFQEQMTFSGINGYLFSMSEQSISAQYCGFIYENPHFSYERSVRHVVVGIGRDATSFDSKDMHYEDTIVRFKNLKIKTGVNVDANLAAQCAGSLEFFPGGQIKKIVYRKDSWIGTCRLTAKFRFLDRVNPKKNKDFAIVRWGNPEVLIFNEQGYVVEYSLMDGTKEKTKYKH